MTSPLKNFERLVRNVRNVGAPAAAEADNVHPFDERNIHPDITAVSRKLFDDGHFPQATFEAFKLIDIKVKDASGIEDTGFSLMMQAFNENGTQIKLNNLMTMSEKDEQRGFRYIFAGAMAGIRNPRGHDIKSDPIDLCLDHLSVASALLRQFEKRK